MTGTLEGVNLYPGGRKVERTDRKGSLWPAEWTRYPDPLTGREVTRFTSSSATDQHPYFTGPAVTQDGRRLVLISERTGDPNLFSLDTGTGEMLQLTDNRFGTLRQYVFHWGNLTGFGKSSVCLNAATGNVYYLQDRQVRKVSAYTADEACIAELPEGYVTAFTHVSGDDRLLCVPLVEEEAFEGGENDGFRDVERAVREKGLKSLLWVVATDGGHEEVRAEQDAWISHVQFHPRDSRYILFNNEAIRDDPGKQRVWMSDGQTGRVWKIRPEPEDRPHWNCHESWTLDGSEILYHGRGLHPETGEQRSFYGFCDPGGGEYREYFIRPEEENSGYGHFTVHPSKDHAYCDGYFNEALIQEVSPGPDGYAEAHPVCRHDTRWLVQDDHPHPILTPDNRSLIFSSSAGGTGNVYGVRL